MHEAERATKSPRPGSAYNQPGKKGLLESLSLGARNPKGSISVSSDIK